MIERFAVARFATPASPVITRSRSTSAETRASSALSRSKTVSTETKEAQASAVPEHAKVVDRLDRLTERLGELRRHL